MKTFILDNVALLVNGKDNKHVIGLLFKNPETGEITIRPIKDSITLEDAMKLLNNQTEA